MTTFTLNDPTGQNSEAVSSALDFLNSGEINFSVLGAGGRPSLALRSVEVALSKHTGANFGLVTIPQMQSFAASGFLDAAVTINPALIANAPKDNGIFGFLTDGNGARDNVISVILHEVLHTDRVVDQHVEFTLNAINQTLSTNTQLGELGRYVIEEKIVRDIVGVLEKASSLRIGINDDPTIENAFTSPAHIGALVNGYQELTPGQKQAIKDFFNNPSYQIPAIKVNGKKYGVVNDQLQEVEFNPQTGQYEAYVGQSEADRIASWSAALADAQPGGNVTPAALGEFADFATTGSNLSTLADQNNMTIAEALDAFSEAGYSSVISGGSANLVKDPATGGWTQPYGGPEGTVADGAGGFVDADDFNGRPDVEALPVVMDLDGDGVEITANFQTAFDWDNDGYKEQTAWAAADDGFLVIDLDANGNRSQETGQNAGDGEITLARELAFSQWVGGNVSDLEALAIFDGSAEGGDGNGRLNKDDSVWNELKIWQDLDQDGEVDDGELKGLGHWGIKSIKLEYDKGAEFGDKEDDIGFSGNILHGVASYILDGGEVVEGGVGDMTLSYNKNGWKRVDTDLGYSIAFEDGRRLSYAVVEADDDKNVDLQAENLDGATGDARDNVLDAAGHLRSVQVSGGNGNDQIMGSERDDLISGDQGDDTLTGRDGNDVIFFDAADSHVRGGADFDTAIVATGVGVNLNLTDTAFEQAIGNDGADRFNAGGAMDSAYLYGGKGADSLLGGLSDDIISGDEGGDDLSGRDGSDFLSGNSGNDSIASGEGDDFVFGGAGADSMRGENGDDTLYGGEGSDTIDGGSHDDFIDGGTGADSLDGGEGDDRIYGGSGHDTVKDGKGDDYIYTGGGDDLIRVTQETGRDSYEMIAGGKGFDVIKLQGNKDDWGRKYLEVDYDVQIGTTSQGDPIMETRQKYTGQYRLTNGSIYIDLMDVERIDFLGDNKSVNLGVSDVNANNIGSFLRSSTVSVNFGQEPHWATNLKWVGTNLDDTMLDQILVTTNPHNGEEIFSYENTNPESFVGGSGNDNIAAGGRSDTLSGNAGHDVLSGAAAADDLSGGAGDDTLYGGLGNDVLTGGAGTDSLMGGDGADSVTGGRGSDIIAGEAGHDTLKGGDGADLVGGGSGNDRIYGEEGADRLYGEIGNDTLYGGMSNDSLYGGDWADTLTGSYGDDLLVGGTGGDSLHGGDGRDQLYGEAGHDTLVGSWGQDALFGGSWSDRLDGGGSDDFLEGGGGADRILGGEGLTDIVSYQGSNNAVNVDLSRFDEEEPLEQIGGDAAGDKITGVEGVLGSENGDTLRGNGSRNELFGGAGHDTLMGRDGRDTLEGGDGNDDLDGGDSHDWLRGGAGNDTLFGQAHDDSLWAGAGDDHLLGQDGDDELYGDTGADTLAGGYDNDLIHGGEGDDSLTGGGDGGEDTLYGGAGADKLFGGAGHDSLNAGSGVDRVEADDGHDSVTGGSGADRILGGDGNDIVNYQSSSHAVSVILGRKDADGNSAGQRFGDAEGDILTGVEGIFGSNYGDTLTGKATDDEINGHGGDDTIVGGTGADTLSGGEGDDEISGDDGDDLIYGREGADSVQGGKGDDTLNGADNADTLRGGDGADDLTGGDGDDLLYGGDGDDRLSGGRGNDTMTGGAGADTFVFKDGVAPDPDNGVENSLQGEDRITDFNLNLDKLDLSDFNYADRADALSHAEVAGGHVKFSFGDGDSVIIANTSLSDFEDDVILIL